MSYAGYSLRKATYALLTAVAVLGDVYELARGGAN